MPTGGYTKRFLAPRCIGPAVIWTGVFQGLQASQLWAVAL